ncbi:MAG TPA: phosphoribosylaminoimidazolesuccinocarboxamide synthase [Candidatus Saccharimonadales bacterium]|nr:phosphoribosylaminoimidazolesuccinocarboxamide synthase [Candidatus Saccharimonadales bacterium]
MQTLGATDFHFNGQVSVYHGKVRDVYVTDSQFIAVATDRISAFDVILPREIPFKGQVLNQTAAYFLEQTADIVPNWLEAVPDPNVSVGKKAEPVKIEMVVRGILVGHAWREYKDGKRELCGITLPDGLREYDAFPEPIITPSTKADEGHDEDISADEILAQGLATPEEWQQLSDYSLKLFARGQETARSRGLVLADTKYEFGTVDGKIILIDEVHTPDSSRYFYADSYDAFAAGKSQDKPKHLSKEFVREWLLNKGFSGQAGQQIPDMDDDFVQQVSDRYIELYEELTGKKFKKSDTKDIAGRIEANTERYLEKAS